MGRAPCCEKVGLKRGRWTAEEDEILRKYIDANGEGSWRSLPKNAGLLRCGKSCRLRWINYLRSDLKRGNITAEEEDIILKLHATLGNRWSLIAGQLPGRTDNEIKNYWNSHLSRKISSYGPGNPILNSQMTTTTTTTKAAAVAGIATPKRRGGRTSRAAMKKNRGVVPTAAGAYNIITPIRNISRYSSLPVLNNDNDSSSNNNNKLNYRKDDGDINDRTKKKKKKKKDSNNNNVVARGTIQTLTATNGSVVTTANTALRGKHQLAASNNYNMITSPNYEPHISSSLILTSPNYSINNNNNNNNNEEEEEGGGCLITTNQGLTSAVDIKGHVVHHRTTTDHQDDMLCFDHDLMVSPAGLILTSTEGEVNNSSAKNNTTTSSSVVVLAGEAADHESSCCEQRTLNSTTSTNTANSSTTVASYLHHQQDHNSNNTCCWFDIEDQSGSINNTSCFANSAVDDSLLMWEDNINVEGGGVHDDTNKDIFSWLWDTSSTHDDHHMDPPAADNTTTTGSPPTITNTPQDFGDLESRQQALVAWLLS